jgi:hypothetical protein
MWVCYCTAKPLNPGWTYETRCIERHIAVASCRLEVQTEVLCA